MPNMSSARAPGAMLTGKAINTRTTERKKSASICDAALSRAEMALRRKSRCLADYMGETDVSDSSCFIESRTCCICAPPVGLSCIVLLYHMIMASEGGSTTIFRALFFVFGPSDSQQTRYYQTRC